jgi:hypothetical protein
MANRMTAFKLLMREIFDADRDCSNCKYSFLGETTFDASEVWKEMTEDEKDS